MTRAIFLLIGVVVALFLAVPPAQAECLKWGRDHIGTRVCMADDLVNRNLVTPETEPLTGTWSGSVLTTANSCTLATLGIPDGAVAIDWACVEKRAAEYDPRSMKDIYPAIAHVLKAVRDGTAKAR